MPTTQDLIPELEAACEGLLWRSETDYPFEVAILSAGAQCPKVDSLLKNYPDDTPIVTVSLDDFFGQATVERAWFDSRELTLVERYRNLRDLLETTLENLQVYRIGNGEMDVYLIGETEDEQVVGVKTKIVET
ncbi:nuclease a inhibitor-like protein [Leptolyngbya sp. Heron Island J]|uniref:nuclease A inhibitor family protein n=1 Tax=Leptolyngbya sp. Heron Island J TaxID=1385935 RepID=UPI0003B9A6CD|nr:nuclease A inhibitor family protein [Leptolyngbya sp. Heron Island J]ESA34783.1 nuclease a inhibitor-like protein [Leptolyngbya sp. Heron Island J]